MLKVFSITTNYILFWKSLYYYLFTYKERKKV